MDTIIIRNKPSEYIAITPGPEIDKISRIALLRMIANAIKDVEAGNGRDIDLTI